MSYHTPLDTNMFTVKTQTRAERKRIEREQLRQDAKYTLTRSQIEAMKVEMRKEIIQEEFKTIEDIMFSAFIISLHDKEGMNKEQLERVIKNAMSHLECIKSGYLNKGELKEMAEAIKGELKEIMGE